MGDWLNGWLRFHGKLSGGEGKVTLQVSDQSAFTVRLMQSVTSGTGRVDWLPLWKSGKALVDGLGQSSIRLGFKYTFLLEKR